eukprot:TRINITY_DN4439_c0_g1_i1.p1 TRINITY_DN4439_c0_g1~~TRINITY_DN4439_c0_g1_i1.p1  ORF type:complete len:225 (-),score=46.69 TRINITY_DN4439_c0_g1_i1:287-961(-)
MLSKMMKLGAIVFMFQQCTLSIARDVEKESKCPEVTVAQNFDLSAFVKSRWYIQQQMNIDYLPKDSNNCVYAEYEVLSKPTFWGYDVQVHNHAVTDAGKIRDSGSYICATIGKQEPAKLEVGPCFLPRLSGWTTGPYWVLAFDDEKGYALISGGQPTIKTESGCRTGTGANGSGLWIFTREQQRNEELIQEARGIAAAKGFDLSVLNDIDNSKCGRHEDVSITV